RITGTRAVDLGDLVGPHQGPGSDVAGEAQRLGPQRAADQHGVAPFAGVRPPSAVLPRARAWVATASSAPASCAAARRRYASGPTRGWSARPTHTASTGAQPSSAPRPGRRLWALPDRHRGARTTATRGGATEATAPPRYPVTST